MIRTRNYNFSESKPIEDNHKVETRRLQTARYVADMLLELRHLAKCNGFTTLQGLLEISYYEAFNAATKVHLPEGEEEFLHGLGSDARKAFVA